jgi:hypothetical protein
MTSERLLLRFFDIEGFFVGCGGTTGLSESRIGPMAPIGGGIRGSKRVSEGMIGPIEPTGAPRVL